MSIAPENRCARPWLPLLACLLSSAFSLWGQSASTCSPSPEVLSALKRIPAEPALDQSKYEFLQAQRSAAHSAMERYPGDVFVQRAYISSLSNSPGDRARVGAEYQTLHGERPDDAYLAYLYGITLLGRDTPQAIRLFTTALERAPNFPWPHLQLVSVYSTPNFRDKALAVAHAKAFLSACPATLEGYTLLGELGDDELIRQGASQLRQAIERRSDPDGLGAYPTLWQLEFAARPSSEYEAVRKQVAADVAHLRALNLENVRSWWRALEEGYTLIKDSKQSSWAADQGARRFPSNANLPERTRWYEDHTYPGADAPAEKTRSYYQDLLQHTDVWIQQRPNSYAIWFDRLQALERLDEVAAVEVESCATKLLAIARADKGPEPLDSVTDYQVLFALYHRKLQPQRQLELAQKAREQREIEYQQMGDDRYVTKKTLEDTNFWRPYWRFSGRFYEADAYIRLKQAAKAADALAQADAALREIQPQINGKDEFRKAYAAQEYSYWHAEARLGELQGHRLDAMAYYQSALLSRMNSGSVPAPGEKDDLAQDAHRLWAALGGSEESWKRWYIRRADAIAAQTHLLWENAEEPLPAFHLADLQGKTWQPADLRGKVVFLNVWASW